MDNKNLPVAKRPSDLEKIEPTPPTRTERMAAEVLRAGTASVPIIGQILERVTFGVEDQIAEEEYQRSVKELLKNLHDEISDLNVELSEADAFRVARRLIQTGQFSSIEEKLDSLSLAYSGFEMKFMAELRTLVSGPDETQRIVAAEVAKLREQLNQDIRKFLSEELLRFGGVGRPHRFATSELSVADLLFFQKLASYVRARSKHSFDSYLVDATEIIGFVAPNDNDLQHFLPTACSLEVGPELYVSSRTLIEISRVFEALRSRQERGAIGHRINKTELTTHHKRLISEAFQLHRLHYLMKQGRFEKLDESFLAPESPLGEQFAAEYHSSAREISRRKMHVQSASLDVDAFNVAILKVAALAPTETGGTFGLITRDKVLYGLDASNRKDSKVLLPWEYALGVFLESHQGSRDYWPRTLTYGQSEETDSKIDRLLQAKIDNDTRPQDIRHLQGVVADLGFLGETANAFSELVSSMYKWLANENIWDLQGVEKSLLAQDADDKWQTALDDLDEVIFETSLSLERAIRK